MEWAELRERLLQGRKLPHKPLAFICHPLKGDVTGNIEKVRQIVREFPEKHPGIVPVAPHLLFATALDDDNPHDREVGMAYSAALLLRCDVVFVYGDWDLSEGCQKEIALAKQALIPVEYCS